MYESAVWEVMRQMATQATTPMVPLSHAGRASHDETKGQNKVAGPTKRGMPHQAHTTTIGTTTWWQI